MDCIFFFRFYVFMKVHENKRKIECFVLFLLLCIIYSLPVDVRDKYIHRIMTFHYSVEMARHELEK